MEEERCILSNATRCSHKLLSLGRLYQVEYAMEAISHASTALGILAKDGLVIAAEKKVASKLLDETKGGEKIYIINEYVFWQWEITG